MKKSKIAKLENGLYRIYWKDGSSDLAAVGRNGYSEAWMAPINWTDSTCDEAWRDVKKAVLLFK